MHRTAPLSLTDALRAARETRGLEIGKGVIQKAPQVFREHFGNRLAVIVADENTLAAAGDTVREAFLASGRAMVEPFIFHDPDLYAEHRFVAELEASLRRHAAIPVAIGSGTINDLTKLAAHRTDRPYLCIATAASMDGYTAFGASITHHGSKQTFDCPAPTAVIADLEVISSAPVAMNAWGYADLLAKITAGADWILADALEIEPIEPLAWNIVQGGLRNAVADPAGVRAGDSAAIGRLIEGLMLGGFAMQATRSSRPASGAEHQFSHLWDMQHHMHRGRVPSHGLKVGVGTLAVIALYEALLAQPIEMLDIDRCCAEWPDEMTAVARSRELCGDGELGAVAAREIAAKHCSVDEVRRQLERLRAVWSDLRRTLRAQLIFFPVLKGMLQTAGAATEPEQIGISRTRMRESYWQAYSIRRRFTVLDLAVRAGLLETCLASVFGPNGVWPSELPTPAALA
jgi:glycerol-1-phosphate dehydrogenase [NAD(P)+]